MGVISNTRILIAFFFLLLALVWLRTNKVIVSIFLVTIFTLPFFQPNKYYSVEVFRGNELVYDIFLNSKAGYFLGYGINIPNIFICLCLVVIGRELILDRRRLSVFTNKFIAPVLLSALAFFMIGLYSSGQHSPFIVLSFTWLVQYMQLYIVACVMFYIYVCYIKQFVLIYPVLSVSLLLQVLIALWQFLRQSSTGLIIEYWNQISVFAPGLDEVNSLFRATGTLVSPNQFALVVLLFIIILAPYALRKSNAYYLIASVLGLVIIILSQSRSIWIASAICVTTFILVYKKELKKIINNIGTKKVIVYGMLILTSISFVIFPRVILSMNVFIEGAGIPVRIRMVKEGLETLALSPWIGYGVGTNEYALYLQFPTGVMSYFASAVHLAFLQLALEVGFIGLLLFLYPFLYYLRKVINKNYGKKLKSENKDMIFSFLTGLSAFLIYYSFHPHAGTVEFPFLGIVLGFGMILSYGKKNKTYIEE